MPAKHPVTNTLRPARPRLSAAERRAAQIAAVATQQADLKREAAERRLARAERAEPPRAPKSPGNTAARRAGAR